MVVNYSSILTVKSMVKTTTVNYHGKLPPEKNTPLKGSNTLAI
jgi:hypothetical protein